jgi:hypothetical protein
VQFRTVMMHGMLCLCLLMMSKTVCRRNGLLLLFFAVFLTQSMNKSNWDRARIQNSYRKPSKLKSLALLKFCSICKVKLNIGTNMHFVSEIVG